LNDKLTLLFELRQTRHIRSHFLFFIIRLAICCNIRNFWLADISTQLVQLVHNG